MGKGKTLFPKGKATVKRKKQVMVSGTAKISLLKNKFPPNIRDFFGLKNSFYKITKLSRNFRGEGSAPNKDLKQDSRSNRWLCCSTNFSKQIRSDKRREMSAGSFILWASSLHR